jgi:catechol 2,3-dioxygenase-like lactoylglutathione lyase family enzyme
MPETAGVRSIVAIVPAREFQRSIDFYKALGFQADLYDGGLEYCFLHIGGCTVHLRKAALCEFTVNPGGLYVYVDDADQFHTRLMANGITPLGPPRDCPWRCREFAVSDPDGLLIRIGQLIS